jgi:hypothetical protein
MQDAEVRNLLICDMFRAATIAVRRGPFFFSKKILKRGFVMILKRITASAVAILPASSPGPFNQASAPICRMCP